MPIDPNIILQGMPQTFDTNALLQQQMQGLQNINVLERQRKADEEAAQEALQAETLRALSPAVAAAFEDPSDAGLDAAFSLVPEEFGAAADEQLAQLRAIPDVNRRKAVIRSALLQDDYGRALLAQLEPTANMRLQAETAKRRADIDQKRYEIELANLEAEAARGPEASYKEIVLDDGTLLLMDTKSGKFIKPTLAGPIDTALPPDETAGKPLKVRQKDGAAASESERLAAYNSGRVLQAAEDIVSAIQTDPTAVSPGNLEAAVGNVADPNIVRSAERQQVVSAQRELIDALLTLATGAAYNREQREGQIEGFVPKWSDKPAQVKSKLNRTLKTIEIAKVKSGRAWTPEMDAAFQQLIKTFGVEEGETAPPTAAAPPAEGTSVSNW